MRGEFALALSIERAADKAAKQAQVASERFGPTVRPTVNLTEVEIALRAALMRMREASVAYDDLVNARMRGSGDEGFIAGYIARAKGAA